MSVTTENRFQVSCSVCGLLDSFRTFDSALTYAELMRIRHCNSDEQVTIFDLLAHKGKPELYDHHGKPLKFRATE